MAVRVDPDDAPREAIALEAADHPTAGVDLPTAEAVERGRREGVSGSAMPDGAESRLPRVGTTVYEAVAEGRPLLVISRVSTLPAGSPAN